MQVEVLLKHIASVPVVQNIPALVKRIAGSQLPHGAEIIIDLFQKVLLRYHPHALALANAPTEREQPSPVVLSTPLSPQLKHDTNNDLEDDGKEDCSRICAPIPRKSPNSSKGVKGKLTRSRIF
jgi:hypothetical protein